MRELYSFFPGAFLCLVVSFATPMQGVAQVQTPRYITTSANSNGFYEYLPAGYETGSETYPLMIFLHGSGELGNGGSDLPIVLRNGPPKLISEGTFPASFTVNGSSYSFIVLSPQFINWPSESDVDALVTYALQHYRVNTNRIYMTGLSMGGGATWDYSSLNSTFANKLAAIVVISGAAELNTNRAQIIASANLPVYALQNLDDPTVPSSYTVNNIALINGSSPPPDPVAIDTIFPVSGHDAWDKSYDPAFINPRIGLNVYQWMLQYQRGTSIILPVTLTDYQAVLSPGTPRVTVSWTTSLEQDNNYFILQRSADAQQFSDLDTIPGNNQGGTHSYSYVDQAPLAGDNFYRLTQVDADGKTTYFTVLKVTVAIPSSSSLRVSPNPAGNTLYLELTDPQQGPLKVNISDVQGRVVRTWIFQKPTVRWNQPIDLSGLPAGNYFIQVTGGTIHTVQQFVKI